MLARTGTLVVLGIFVNLSVGVAAQEVAKGSVNSSGQTSPLVGPAVPPSATPPPPPPTTLPEPPHEQPLTSSPLLYQGW